MGRGILGFLLPGVLLCSGRLLASPPPLQLRSDPGSFLVGPAATVLEDPGRRLTIEEVAAADRALFRPVGQDVPNFGFSSSAFWLYLRVVNDCPDTPDWYLLGENYSLSRIEVFWPGVNGGWRRALGGREVSASQRENEHKDTLVRLPLARGATNELYVRITGTGATVTPLYLKNAETLHRHDYRDILINGIYFGIMLVMIFYHLVLYRTIREPFYPYYVLYVFFFALLVLALNGMGLRYFWNSWLWWDLRSAPVLIGLNCFFILRFMKAFLEIDASWPVGRLAVNFAQAVAAALVVTALFAPPALSNTLDAVVAMGCAVLILAVGILAGWRRHPAAGIFLLAWGALLASVLVSGLKDFGLIPDSFLTRYVLQLGSALQAVLFAFALAWRLDRINRAKENLLIEANLNLEARVAERTAQLDASLKDQYALNDRLLEISSSLKSVNRELEAEKKNRDDDFQRAEIVQRTILTPPQEYRGIAGFDIDVVYLPMNGRVSGDYYNICSNGCGQASFLIADACGHGIQAALSTMQLDLLYNQGLAISDSGRRMEYLNKMMVDELHSPNFCTAFTAHLEDHLVRYASAGHPVQYLLQGRDGACIPLEAKGIPLGFYGDRNYLQRSHPFELDDILVLFTDGIFEQFDAQDVPFGETRLRGLLQSLAADRTMSMNELNSTILDALRAFLGDGPFQDDITLISARMI